MSILCLLSSWLMMQQGYAQLILTNGTPSATIDFSNSMQTTVGSNPATAFAGAGFESNTTTAGRLNSNAWAVTGWSDGALNYGGTQITATTDYTRGAAAAAVTTGGLYASRVAPGSAANPILMFQAGGSDFDPGTLTLRIQNNGTTIINQLALSYNLYVRNDQARADSLNFSWSTDNATFTPVPALDYGSTAAADALGWVIVGSAPSRSTTITGISVPPSSYIYLRWSHVSSGSSSRDEIGLDDISVTATYSSPCTQPSTQGTINSFSGVGSYQMNVNYTRGNGTGGVLIIASTSNTLSSNPISGTNYSANSNFGNGDPLGGGFVVYNGTANGTGAAASLTVTGLSPSTTYYFYIFEYNVTVPCYMTPGNTGNQATLAGSSTAPTDYFRTIASGNWNNTLTWESSSNNITWQTATAKPTSSSSGITIRSGHTVTISAPETAKLLTIAAGGTLTYANQASGGYDLDFVDGAGFDFIINGTYELYGIQPGLPLGTTVQVNGLVKVNGNNGGVTSSDDFGYNTQVFWTTGAIFEWNTTNTYSASGRIYFPNAAATDIAIFRQSATTTFSIGGASATQILGRYEGNATASFTGAGLKVFRNGIIGTGNLTQLAGCGQLQISGTAQLGGTGSITLDANGMLITSASSTTFLNDKTVNSGPFSVDGTFNMSSFVLSGSCNFTLNAAGILVMGSPDGITTGALGNVQTSGGRNFNTAGIYWYLRSGNQTTGNALPASITGTGELRIQNTGAAGNNTTTLTNTGTTTITLRLIFGNFAVGTSQQLNISAGGTIFGSGGAQSQAVSEGYINFNSTGTISPGSGLQLTNVRLNGGVNTGGANTTINRTLDIASGGFVTAGTAPTYASSPASTLQYSCNCNYGAGEEWYANTFGTSAGVPHHVTLVSGTSLNFGSTGFAHEMRGDLTINNSSTFALSSSSGGDLYIKGNWNRGSSGTFTHNTRLVKFNGTSGNQTITVTGGGTETFAYLAIEKSAGQSVVLAAAPNSTNVTVNGATGGNSFRMMSGDLDLNQRTFTFTSFFGGVQNNLGIDGTVGNLVRTINSTGGPGTFNIINTNAGNNVVTVTRMSGNASTLVVGTNALMTISSSAGPSGLNPGSGLTTINGTLQLNSFGYVTGNSPSYGTNSFLVYNTGSTFDRNVEWCCTSGAGYPFNVTVQGGTNIRLNTPSINGDADRALAGNLWIKSASTLVLSTTANNTLSVGKSLQLDGTLNLPTSVGGDIYIGENWNRSATGVFNHNDRAVFFNTAQNSTITAVNGQFFPYLYISKTAVGNTVSLVDSIAIEKEMSVISGTFDPANKDAVLLSSATNTARFGQVGASGALAYSGSGRFIVERYLPTGTGGGQHPKSWQFLAVPTNGGQTVNAAWQEGANTPNQDNKPGYGTMITGNMSGATGLGFDAETYAGAGPGMKTYNAATNTWTGIPNTTSTALYNKKGYMLFVRGDRSVTSFSGAGSTPVPTTLRSRGKLFEPTSNPVLSTSIAAGTFESIGNPYASAIDFTLITKPSAPAVDDVFYVWDPLLPGSSGYGLGGYQMISSANLYKPSPGGTANYSNATAYTKINSGQAFFMHATGAGGTVSFSEASKVTGADLTYRGNPGTVATGRQFLRTQLLSNNWLIDAAIVAFDPAFSNRYDAQDALKLASGGEAIAIHCQGNAVSLEARKPVSRRDTVFLQLSGLRSQVPYELRLGPDNMPLNGLQAWLVDQYRDTRIPVSMGDSTYYSFTITEDPLSADPFRFLIVFNRAGNRPLSDILTHSQALPPQTLTRLGQSETSMESNSSLDIFPNPVTNGQAKLRFVNMQAGSYQLQLQDPTGKTAWNSRVTVNSVQQTHHLALPKLAAGIYRLKVWGPDGSSYHAILVID